MCTCSSSGLNMQKQSLLSLIWSHKCERPSVMKDRPVTYGDVLLQAALRENPVQFGSELSLSQDGEHHALQHHGLGALKIHKQQHSQHFRQHGVHSTSTVSTHHSRRVANETKSSFWSHRLKTLEWMKSLLSHFQTQLCFSVWFHPKTASFWLRRIRTTDPVSNSTISYL